VKFAETYVDGVSAWLCVFVLSTPSKEIVLYFHGGGWVVSSVESYSRFCGVFARVANVIVVAVEYRFASIFPYLVVLND
jgi:acetyl esterase/lipase